MNDDKVDVDDTLSVQFEEPIMIKSEPEEFEPIDSLVIIPKRKKEKLYKEIHSQKLEILKLKEKLKKSELKRCEQFLKIRMLTELRSHFNVSVESTKMETDTSTQTDVNENSTEQKVLESKFTQTSILEMKQLQIEPKVLIVSHSSNFWHRKGKVVKNKLDRYSEMVHEKDVYGIKSRNVSKNTLKLKKIVDEVVDDLVKFNEKLVDQNSNSLHQKSIPSRKDKVIYDKIAFRDILELSKSKIDHDNNLSMKSENLRIKDWTQQIERVQLKTLADQVIA